MPDILNLLRSHHVDFITAGKNVKKGNVNVACPFCGPADPSYHLGIDLQTGYWGCWRNGDHRGKDLTRLLVALLHISHGEAKDLVEAEAVPEGTWADLRQRAHRLLCPLEKGLDPPPDPVSFPAEFERVNRRSSFAGRFWAYLERERGFDDSTKRLVEQYDLQFAFSGYWAWRLILPVYVGGELKGWQGRAIGDAGLRYLTYPNSSALKKVVYNQDVSGGDVLVICEGPFDTLKIDVGGRDCGIRSVATLGTSFVEAQVGVLLRLSAFFRKTVILYDPGAHSAAMNLKQKLSVIRPTLGRLPDRIEDPGAFPLDAVPHLIHSLVK